MKIAIPLVQGTLSAHFGHCERFALLDIGENGNILSQEEQIPPPHEPGVLPAWLHELGATHIIAGGMGMRAKELFERHGIQVIVGASQGTAEEIAAAYLNGTLTTGENICDH